MTPSTGATPPPPLRPEPEAHGRAALLLAESTLHALVETSTLSCADAVAVIQCAADVECEAADASGISATCPVGSAELLARIQASFEVDLPIEAVPPVRGVEP